MGVDNNKFSGAQYKTNVYDKLRKMNTDHDSEFFVFCDDKYLKKALALFLEDNNLYTIGNKTERNCIHIVLKYGKYNYISSYENVEKLYELPYDWDELMMKIKKYLKNNPIEKKEDDDIPLAEKMMGHDPLEEENKKDVVGNIADKAEGLKSKIGSILNRKKEEKSNDDTIEASNENDVNDEDYQEGLEEFKEMTGYDFDGEFIFAMSLAEDFDGGLTTNISINPKVIWDNDGHLYDQHINYELINLPEKIGSIMESIYEHEYSTDEEAIKALVDKGFKYESSFQSFMESGTGFPKYTINGLSMDEYMEENHPNAIIQ